MTSFLEWLLDLDDIRLGRDAPLLLAWVNALPAWVLFCFAVVALGLIAVVYRREHTARGRRVALAAIRAALVALVITIVCKPVLVWQRNRIERAYVAVAVDTSLSMGIAESYADERLAGSIAGGADLTSAGELSLYSRLALIKRAVCRDDGQPLSLLVRSNALQFSTFSSALEVQAWAFDEGSVPAVVDALRACQPEGTRTDLADAIDALMEAAQGRRLAAIVLATDGRSTSVGHLKDALARAGDRKIPIYPLLVGSPEPRLDIEVGALRAESRVFVRDYFLIDASVTAFGIQEARTLDVQLVDERSGKVVDVERITLDPSHPTASVELQARPQSPGKIRYRVEVAALPNERTLDNNRSHVDVTVLSDRVRVLYVESYPRFEYRYLKNALLREKTVHLSVLLLEADEAFVQEGTDPIRRFPETPEELNRYDVVLFGDVDPQGGWLTLAQMNMLLDFVGYQGGGFGLIAGERAAPHRFLGTPLERLIPVRIDATFQGLDETHAVRGYKPQLTPEGARGRIFRVLPRSTDRRQTVQSAAFSLGAAKRLETFPALHWLARTLGPKPGATVLAEHPTMMTSADVPVGSGRMPVIVTGRYGAGATLFQATDDTWRWRRGDGEFYHDTYWLQVVRALTRPDQIAQDRRFSIRTDRRVYDYGIAVQLQVEILDSQLLAGDRRTVQLAITRSESSDRRRATGKDDRGMNDRSSVHRLEAHRLGPNTNLYEGSYVPSRPGSFVARVTDLVSGTERKAPSAAFRVGRPDLEFRRPEADHETLALIAEATGGQVIHLDNLEEGLSAIQDASVRIPDDVVEPLWDSKLVLILFVAMISMEWILRKAYGLL